MPAPTRLRTTLHEAGLRLTGQRELLLQLLQEHGGHLDAHELYRLAHERDPQLNLSTVYRTLSLLRDLGLVNELHLGEEHHHYELRTPATHYHLICSACGAVVEFASPLIEQLKADVGRKNDYEIFDASVDLIGVCAACRAAMATESEAARQERKVSPRERVLSMLRGSARPSGVQPQPATLVPAPTEKRSTALHDLATGAAGRVAALTGGRDLTARLAALGLTPGAACEVVQNPAHGPVIVLVRDTRLALGRGEAAHVQVIPVEAST
jgi:Fe2+ or Zn2+ uptake regulation protein/Fe2+ transport system protein FeoA